MGYPLPGFLVDVFFGVRVPIPLPVMLVTGFVAISLGSLNSVSIAVRKASIADFTFGFRSNSLADRTLKFSAMLPGVADITKPQDSLHEDIFGSSIDFIVIVMRHACWISAIITSGVFLDSVALGNTPLFAFPDLGEVFPPVFDTPVVGALAVAIVHAFPHASAMGRRSSGNCLYCPLPSYAALSFTKRGMPSDALIIWYTQ